MKDVYGVLVSLSPKGTLQRQLVAVGGEIELPETTLEEEIILYSELNFEPYAAVVDMLRTTAAFLPAEGEKSASAEEQNVTLSFWRPCRIWWRRLNARMFFTVR